MSVPTPASSSTPDRPNDSNEVVAARRKATRLLGRLIDELPADVVLRVAEDADLPRALTKARLDAVQKAHGRDAAFAALWQYRRRLAYLAHDLGMALVFDGLRQQSAGSGETDTDLDVISGSLIDRYDLNDLRRTPLTPEERMRRQWNGMRRRVTPLVLERCGHVCLYCGTEENLGVDHLQPIARGGTNDFENLTACCGSCNSRKSTRTEDEFWAVLAEAVPA